MTRGLVLPGTNETINFSVTSSLEPLSEPDGLGL